MALVSLTNAYFDFGRERILAGVNLALHPGVKYALVGANGAGKTTLLSALSGHLQLQGGTRQVTGTARIKLLRQETSMDPQRDGQEGLLEAVSRAAFARERELGEALATVAGQLETQDPSRHDELVEEQGKLQSEFERLDGYTVTARLESALRGVGLLPETWERPVARLSGGERRRAALAAVLLSGADLLLLDEPTNHLDLESCEWLENFLTLCPSAAVIVSHDRQFLDRVVSRTLHLERGRVVSYKGNYSFYDTQSALRYEQDMAAWQRQQAKIRQTEEYIRRNIEGQKTKQAQSRRKLLEKEEKLERPTTEPGLFRFKLEPARPSGGTVLQTEGLGKSFGGQCVLADFELHVSRGERLGVVGPNGCGKSTLLKMIAGKIVPDTGRVVMGHNVDLGYYDQELASVSDHNTVIAEMGAVDPRATLGELRSFLGAFGFGEDLYDRQVGRLSGGERGRLALMRLIKEGHNTLLLDEPTNHLDIRSRESLEAALAAYRGTLVVVSHDRRFLDKVVEKLILFPPADKTDRAGRVQVFLGNYAEFARDRDQRRAQQNKATGSRNKSGQNGRDMAKTAADPVSGRVPLSKNEQKRRHELIAAAEEKIHVLEAEKETALEALSHPDLDNDKRVDLARRCTEIETELDGHLSDWEQWSLEIEEGIRPD